MAALFLGTIFFTVCYWVHRDSFGEVSKADTFAYAFLAANLAAACYATTYFFQWLEKLGA